MRIALAHLYNRALFFTTSPRSPAKMIPEIGLLHEYFNGRDWDSDTQTEFIDKLAESNFFEGVGSPKDKPFSARDRINRAPKALGFIDLSPRLSLTPAGNELIHSQRPQEIFLRQLLKFQLPSPYHIENRDIAGTFWIHPYLEIMRLIRELDYITFDEFKIFAIQLTDYRNFDLIKHAILLFRIEKENRKGKYKQFVNEKWTEAVEAIYKSDIERGATKTRQTNDSSLKKFISTKKSNLRDYADACFRYLRFTGLLSISHKGRSISFFPDKIVEVDYLLRTVDREPAFVDNMEAYKEYLFNSEEPVLYVDIKENIIDILMRIHTFTKRELSDKTVEELKNIRDTTILAKRKAVIDEQVVQLKSYALYSEIIDTFNEIVSDELYDAPLMLEWNTWRAMTMLDGGIITGNFRVDDAGQPMSTAQGNMPDIECDYGDFVLSVEVTLQSGQRQYESEGEPVARHYGQLRKRAGKEAYCLFIAPTVNNAALAHFFALNKMEIAYYGGKTRIIPLDLDQFMRLIDNSYNYRLSPNPKNVYAFLESVMEQVDIAVDENDWKVRIQSCVESWLVA